MLASAISVLVLCACALLANAFSPAEPTLAPVLLSSTASITPSSPPTRQPTSTQTSTEQPTSTPTPSPSPTPLPVTRLLEEIPAPSLAGNLLHEPDVQTAYIYLPPSYAGSNLRYPVVYFLPGYGSEGSDHANFFSTDQLTELIALGTLPEMILVIPNGANRLHGSFYVNSPVTGNWEDFIVEDVVGYIDASYRTISAPQGRGIGGHSMGGFGAFNLAMRHPDVFGAAYCLSSAFFDEQGMDDSMLFDKDRKPYRILQELQAISNLPVEEAIDRMTMLDGALGFTMAYGAAFAPNPSLGPPFFDYPYRLVNSEAQLVPAIWERWEAGLGNWKEKISKHRLDLLTLRGIVIDYGARDKYPWIPPGSKYLARQLTKAGIPNKIYEFDGTHGDRLSERLVEVMLPFFDQVLVDPYHPANFAKY